MTGARDASTEPLFAGAEGPAAEYRFAVPVRDQAIVQETHETAYHVLWELVHVFFEQPGLLDEGEGCITCGDVAVTARVAEVRGATAVIEKYGAREEIAIDLVEEVRVGDQLLCHAGVALERVENGADDPTDFLYPFQSSGTKSDLASVLADVRASTLEKAGEVTALRRAIDNEAISSCAEELRRRLEGGGRLIAFGNGGSATDAQDIATDALDRGFHAIALNNDAATVTAVANDVGTEQIFARQLIALGRPEDVCVAISTSGGSPNVIAAIEEAKRRGLTTVALAGYDGGRLTELDSLDHLFVVPSDHIPRIQEAQATIYHLLLEAIGDRSPAGDRSPGGVSE
jgi:D-sedoheptulose 7-phosphate isomerase